MSTLRRIDSLLDGKTSDQLASEVGARARERAENDQRGSHRPPSAPVDLRPLVVRTSGSVTEGIYGLVLALSVVAVSWYDFAAWPLDLRPTRCSAADRVAECPASLSHPGRR
jgi:hypothetical protein